MVHQLYYTLYTDLTKGDVKYVSDECWYVSSARNMLYKYFGLKPNSIVNGKEYATVLCTSSTIRDEVSSFVETVGGIILKIYDKQLRIGYPYALGVLMPIEYINELKSWNGVLIIEGYPYPDWNGITEYLNLEHPPLVKYILCLTLLVKDNPVAWRIPSIIAGALIIFFAYLIASKVFNSWIGVVAALSVAIEPVVRSMSLVAMLDIYVALFSIISLYFTLAGRYYLAAVFIGLAGSSKMSGFFNSLALMIAGWRNLDRRRLLLCVIVIPAFVFFIINIPIIINEGGLINWINLLLWAIGWHTTSRPPNGPPVSNPWDWFIARNPFPLHFSPDLYAMPSPFLMLLTLPLTAILIPLALKALRPGVGSILSWYWVPIGMYILLYFIGNRTQYSFYTVHITPIAVLIVVSIVYLITDLNLLLKILKTYLVEGNYRVPLFTCFGIILFIVISYLLPLFGVYRVLISAIVATAVAALMVENVKQKIIIGFITVSIGELIIVLIWLSTAFEFITRLFTKFTFYALTPIMIAPLFGILGSLIMMPASKKVFSVIESLREKEEEVLDLRKMDEVNNDDN